MAETSPLPVTPDYRFSLECDVLPILKLARWSAQSGAVLSELRAAKEASPQFAASCRQMLGGAVFPDEVHSFGVVAGALSVAEAMLQNYIDAAGGDV